MPLLLCGPIGGRAEEQRVGFPLAWGLEFRGLGFRGLGFRGLGFRGLGFRGLGFRVIGLLNP